MTDGGVQQARHPTVEREGVVRLQHDVVAGLEELPAAQHALDRDQRVGAAQLAQAVAHRLRASRAGTIAAPPAAVRP